MTIVAALDLGSNTLKLTVADVARDGSLIVLGERAEITRVGQGLDRTKRVDDEAAARTLKGLGELVAFARALGATQIACVGTAGLRGATNAADFLGRVKAELDLDVEIIDGLREAELSFAAPAKSYGPGVIVVVDLGGRSTELVVGHTASVGSPAVIDAKISLEIGSVRLTERFLPSDPPTDAELATLDAYLGEVLRTAPPAPAGARLVGVSGTIMSLMGVQLGLDDMGETVERGEGAVLTLANVRAAYEDLRRKTAKARIRGTVIPEGRADVIVAGAAIAAAIAERYGVDGMLASNRGVRYGLLYELAAR
ncbi:Ppx/GppA family phosphatase [Myxococcota bacterium]|nr:Ppx/GppA family phosphatase [Myxococcota bacterium]